MSEKAVDIAMTLADTLRSSDCYMRYRRCKEIVDNDPVLLQKIKEFKKSQFELQTKVVQNAPFSFDEEKYVSKLYSQLSLNEYAKGYLESEKAVLDLLNEVFGIIGAACEIDLDF